MPTEFKHSHIFKKSIVNQSKLENIDFVCLINSIERRTHRYTLAVHAVHDAERRPQVRIPRLLQFVASVAEAALWKRGKKYSIVFAFNQTKYMIEHKEHGATVDLHLIQTKYILIINTARSTVDLHLFLIY